VVVTNIKFNALYQYIRPERYIKKNYSVPSGKNDFIQLALLLWKQSSLFIYLFIYLFVCLFIYLVFTFLFTVFYSKMTDEECETFNSEPCETTENIEEL